MKKFITAMMALAIGVSAYAVTASTLRVYINPGHGSWTSNDRPMQLVNHPNAYSSTNTDTLSFFESNTNLWKGFGVLETLRAYGLKYDPTLNQSTSVRYSVGAALDMNNNIVMSRVKCGPYASSNTTSSTNATKYNRSLSQVAAEVEANNFDMFISIHSDAAGDVSANRALILYRGKDKSAYSTVPTFVTTCYNMAAKAWPYIIANSNLMLSSTTTNIRGDITFYGSSSTSSLGYTGYLGVLKHSVPGYLVEGYCHTYSPARHRAMNVQSSYLEGANYAHGIADYFGLTDISTGDIHGVVRSATETFTHAQYAGRSGTLDTYKPLNGMTATLFDSAGTKIATYTTDDYYNGVFVFRNVAPGTYTVNVAGPGYPAGTVSVTVKAASIAYTNIQLTPEQGYIPPEVVETVNSNYPDPLAGGWFLPDTKLQFHQALESTAVSELSGKTIRRALVRNGHVYVLALNSANEPTIVVLDSETGAVLANVSTEGMAYSFTLNSSSTGTFDLTRGRKCSDIALTSDGYLIASPLGGTNDDNTGKVTIYKWANDENGIPTGKPVAWLNVTAAGNYYNSYTGESICYSGTATAGYLYFTTETYASSKQLRLSRVKVTSGAATANTDEFCRTSYAGTATARTIFGDVMHLYVSPFGTDNVLVAGSGSTQTLSQWPFVAGADGVSTMYDPTAELTSGLVDATTTGFNFFANAGTIYAATPVKGGFTLLNISAGLGSATKVTHSVTNAPARVAASVLPAFVAAETMTVTDADDRVILGYINSSLLTSDGAIELQTTNLDNGAASRAEYAYDLNATLANGQYTLSFSLSGDVANARIIFTPLVKSAEEVTRELGSLEKGHHSMTIAQSELGNESYTWAVEVSGYTVGRISKLYSESTTFAKATTRGGVVPITDPASPAFGKTVVAYSYAQGFTLFDRDYTEEYSRLNSGSPFSSTNKHSAFRGGELRGRAVFADWSDANTGYWIVDPTDFASAPVNMLQGSKASSGAYTYNGVAIGGGSCCAAFQGEGAETALWAFEEDVYSNSLVRYTIGESDQITAAPTSTFGGKYTSTSYLNNASIDVAPTANGAFIAQLLDENSATTPVLIYIDNAGNLLYNAGSDFASTIDCSSGVALNRDASLLALGGITQNIGIYAVSWSGNTPSLTYLYDIPSSTCARAGQLKFDYAGNLHCFFQDEGYRVYALPNDAPVCTTPTDQVIYGTTAQIDVISDEQPDADAIYFNLQGIQVDPNNLTPGIYIRVKGNTSTKVRI